MTGFLQTFASSPTFGLAVTLAVFVGAKWVYKKVRFFLLHPVLVSIAVIIVVLRMTHVSYASYMAGGKIIGYFLAPTVVALGLPLYEQLTRLRREAVALLLTTLFASAVGILLSVFPLIVFGAARELVVSLAPKSVTTPIAMVISGELGGLPSLTAAIVVLTGVVGATLGPAVLRLIGIRGGIAFGYALGTASHGVGTARALEEGQIEGAASSLALCLNGVATSIFAPIAVRLILHG